MIDVGEYFDAAVMALCLQEQTLLIQGGNFCQQFNVDSVKPGEPCLLCATQLKEEVLLNLVPSKIESHTDLLWIPKDVNPIS